LKKEKAFFFRLGVFAKIPHKGLISRVSMRITS
jgi:hypothetical protein